MLFILYYNMQEDNFLDDMVTGSANRMRNLFLVNYRCVLELTASGDQTVFSHEKREGQGLMAAQMLIKR